MKKKFSHKETTKQVDIPKPIFGAVDDVKKANKEHIGVHFKKNDIPDYIETDYMMACDFLYSYRGSQATFTTYRREVERLMQWCWFVHSQSCLSIGRSDIEAYIEFCQNPPKSWIGTSHVARFIEVEGEKQANPSWRPFVATVSKKAHLDGKVPSTKMFKLSQAAIQSIFSVLSSYYSFLIHEDKVESNPVLQIRQKSKFIRKLQNKVIIRKLSDLQWGYVIESAELLAQNNPKQHERTLFIMNALYSMYLRISELSASARWKPKMGDFFRDQDGFWWFKTVGKGNKERIVSVSDTMLDALKRYRKSLGLSALPPPGDNTMLISSTRTKEPIKSTRGIRKIVQYCFDFSVDRMKKDNLLEEAEMLMSATVHWLRHTGISEDVKTRPREHVRDDAGHSSSAITDRYIDIELRERAKSAKNKKIIPDPQND